MRVPGDTPPGQGGLPRPPEVPGTDLAGFLYSWSHFVKLWTETLPYLASRLAMDTDGHRGSGALPRY